VTVLFLEGDLPVGLEVGAMVSSSWKIVKSHGLFLRGACEVVLDLTISGVEEMLTIRWGLNFTEGLREEGELS
jgi:hypothetical protein